MHDHFVSQLTLIISDLHIGSGRDPRSGKYSPLDDFYGDATLARFLAHYRQHDPAHLVLNGDIFDLTQVIELPSADELPSIIGAPQLDRDRLRYGLGHSTAETCWKLERIVTGHPLCFQALADWLHHGQQIHFVIGNHDPELRDPAVQARLVDLLTQAHPELSPAAVSERVHFHASYLYQPAQRLYAEHGNLYDPVSHLDGDRIPSCYFNNRYLFNALETRTPEADNILPFSRYIGWLLSTDTLPTLGILLPRLPDFLRARRRAGHTLPPPAPPQAPLPPEVENAIRQAAVEQRRRIQEITHRTSLLTAVAVLLNVTAQLAPLAAVALALTGRPLLALLALLTWPLSRAASASIIHNRLHRSMLVENDFLQDAAQQIAPLLAQQQVDSIVMGHTHQVDVQPLPAGLHYYNPGTWVPLFSDDSRLDDREQTYFFVEVCDGQARLLRWNDAAGQPEPPIIIDRRSHLARGTE